MSAPGKKARKTTQLQSSGDHKIETDADDEIEFEGRNPVQSDYHGIRQFLQQLFVNSDVDLSEMSDMFIGSQVATVLHQLEEEEDDQDKYIFAISSIANITSNTKKKCVQQLLNLIRDLSCKHADDNTSTLIKRLISGHDKLGFLINERFVNIPTLVSISMLKSVQDDLEKAKRKDPAYNFDQIVMICKTLKPKDQNDVTYLNEEEEIFVASADLTFELCVDTDTGSGAKCNIEGQQLIPYRKVIIFKADKLPSIISKVEAYVHG